MFLIFKGKYNNPITIPYKVHVGDIFEVNATVINTLPFNVTIISRNCNFDFSTNFYIMTGVGLEPRSNSSGFISRNKKRSLQLTSLYYK
ncbi:MAG TPA: hypothetical protein VIZ62_09040 [Nitrososphaeraceae archaeon]